MARALCAHDSLREPLLAVQHDLVIVMGELATLPDDRDRYQKDGYPLLAPAHTSQLDQWSNASKPRMFPSGLGNSGATAAAAALDFARAVCRRSERRVCALQAAGQCRNPEIIVYLNRLSDALWLSARSIERPPPDSPARP